MMEKWQASRKPERSGNLFGSIQVEDDFTDEQKKKIKKTKDEKQQNTLKATAIRVIAKLFPNT
jgi:hypothetical protein